MSDAVLAPSSWQEARERLAPRAVGATVLALTTLELSLDGRQSASAGVVDAGGDLTTGAVVATPDGDVVVTAGMAADWGVAVPDVVSVAVEGTFGRDVEGARALGEGAYVVQDPDFVGAVSARPALVHGFAVQGRHVVVVPRADVLVVAGSDDVPALLRALAVVDEVVGQGEHLVSPLPRVAGEHGWEDHAWPDDPAVAGLAALVARRWNVAVFTWQQGLLERFYRQQGQVLTLAPIELVAAPDGRAVTYAPVTTALPCAVPPVDDLVFVGDDGDVTRAAWDAVHRHVPDLLQPFATIPQRWVLTRFPTADELAAVRA